MSGVKLITHHLIHELVREIKQASSIYILTSFVMKSGVRLLEPYLKEALDRNADVKLLAGDYLYITQPDALKALLEIDERIRSVCGKVRGRCFIPRRICFRKV